MVKKIAFYIICCIYVVNFGHASIATDIYDKFQQNDYKIELERNEVDYVNKSLAEASFITFPYNRTTKANNFSFLVYNDYAKNDLKVEFQAYKFLSNEYRTFPIHFQMDVCRALDENIGGNKMVFDCGNFTSCPFKKNRKYFTCNNIVEETRYPPLIPSGRYKIGIRIFVKTNTMITANSYLRIYRTLKPGQSGRD